jgi:hypothetical protein
MLSMLAFFEASSSSELEDDMVFDAKLLYSELLTVLWDRLFIIDYWVSLVDTQSLPWDPVKRYYAGLCGFSSLPFSYRYRFLVFEVGGSLRKQEPGEILGAFILSKHSV